MKKILVPCDFSKPSKDAFKVAVELADKVKGDVLLLHVLPIPGLYTDGAMGEPLAFDPAFYTRMEEDARKGLEEIKKLTGRKSVKVATEVVYGELPASIQKLIDQRNIDQVVMGTTGASGLVEILIGSNAEKVVRFSSVPVLAIRKAIKLDSIKRILVPSTLGLNQTDFMNKLKDLQKLLDATLHVLLVNTPARFRRDAEAHEALDEFVKHYKLANFKTHFQNYAHEDDGILEFAHSEKMDLIAMATHARKGLAHLFYTSITESVVNHIETPIWTYRLHA